NQVVYVCTPATQHKTVGPVTADLFVQRTNAVRIAHTQKGACPLPVAGMAKSYDYTFARFKPGIELRCNLHGDTPLEYFTAGPNHHLTNSFCQIAVIIPDVVFEVSVISVIERGLQIGTNNIDPIANESMQDEG